MRRARDEEFQDYVRGRREALLKIATAMTGGDRHLAEDLVQVCLTRLYLAWPRIRTMRLDGYARRVLVNALIDETSAARIRRASPSPACRRASASRNRRLPAMRSCSPPGAGKSPGGFTGKLAVTAQAGSELGHWQAFGNRSVTVNGSQGRIGDDGTATQLWYTAGHGVVVDVQAWDSIGLTDQQLIHFASGITTTPALQLSHG